MIERLRAWGPTVILSDGDVVFQPRKVERSGLSDAVEGRVLIDVHKERELDGVENHYPARRYVPVDDKLRIQTAAKAIWGSRLTTVFPRQGHSASDPTTRPRTRPRTLRSRASATCSGTPGPPCFRVSEAVIARSASIQQS